MHFLSIHSTFQSPSDWNSTLAVLYFTDAPPATLPTTRESVRPPTLDPTLPAGPDNIKPYQLTVRTCWVGIDI